MSRGIRLDRERGVNPRMTLCRQCGGDTPELALLGTADHLHKCTSCGASVLGTVRQKKCSRCGASALVYVRRLGEMEKVPIGGLCDECKKKHEAADTMVKEGGIYWKCDICHSEGAIPKDHPMAVHVREKLNIQPPKPCGVSLVPEDCPVCGKHRGEDAGEERSIEGP